MWLTMLMKLLVKKVAKMVNLMVLKSSTHPNQLGYLYYELPQAMSKCVVCSVITLPNP